MNVDLLIEEVRKRPHLWDRGNSHHSNRRASDNSWRTIAEIMEEDKYKLRKKWRYLRDQFSVEYAKIPPGSQDEVKGYEPKWRFYKQLQFLEEVVTPRVISKHLKRDEESSEKSLSAPDSPASPPTEVVYRKRRNECEVSCDIKEKERKWARSREMAKQKDKASDEAEEEHMYFFRSLVTHVRCIPAHLQLSFRNKVQQVVEQFAYGEPRASPISTQSGLISFEDAKQWC